MPEILWLLLLKEEEGNREGETAESDWNVCFATVKI